MTGKVPRVVVIGGSYVDLAIRCSDIPFAGRSVAGSGFSCTATGPGPNQAAEAALCGCQVHLVSKVGGDPFARMIKQCLAEFNVDTDFVFTAEAKNTGVVTTLVNSAGENTCITCTGANSALGPQDIETAEQIIAESDVCLIHGQLPPDAIVAAIRCAKLRSRKVILNPARPMEQSSGASHDLPNDYFSADILIPNLCEAADITEQHDANIRAAKLIGSDLVARGAGAAVITMGRRGCLIVDRNNAVHIPAFEVELVDQTGRGDAFAGALAAASAAGEGLRKAVKFASAAGALACTKFGSIEALPSKDEIIELLQREETE